MHHPTDRITHTTAFVTPGMEHWLEREIAIRNEGNVLFNDTLRIHIHGIGNVFTDKQDNLSSCFKRQVCYWSKSEILSFCFIQMKVERLKLGVR